MTPTELHLYVTGRTHVVESMDLSLDIESGSDRVELQRYYVQEMTLGCHSRAQKFCYSACTLCLGIVSAINFSIVTTKVSEPAQYL